MFCWSTFLWTFFQICDIEEEISSNEIVGFVFSFRWKRTSFREVSAMVRIVGETDVLRPRPDESRRSSVDNISFENNVKYSETRL
jgi:hypothetical protein